MMNNAVDSIIQPLLNAEEKAREEEKRKKEEEEADKQRQIQYEKDRKKQNEEVARLLREKRNIMSRMGSPNRNSVLNLLNSLEEKQKANDPFSNLDVSSLLQQEINDAQKPSVNLELNPPNTDQQQKEAPVIVERSDKGEKIEPYVKLRTTAQITNNEGSEKKVFDEVNSKIRNDDEIGRLLVEMQKVLGGTFDQQILSVLKKTPQLRGLDFKRIIETMQLRVKDAYEALREKHQSIYYYSNPLAPHMYTDQIGAVINDWISTRGDITDDENTRNAIFEASKKEIIKDLRIYKEQGNELSDEINKFLVSDVLEEIAQTNEGKADTSSKEQLLKSNPWLADVNKDIIYSDFMAYAGNKRKEGFNFNTSLNWAIFKEYYDR